MDSLVSTKWLSRHLGDPDLVVLDCTVRTRDTGDGAMQNFTGRPEYEAGHIPGAGFADLMSDLADTEAPIEFALPEPEAFCAAMGRLGVGDDTRVVLYDDVFSAWAARVWWMLRWVGFDRAAVLDGGFGAWTAEARPLSTDPPNHPERQLSLTLRPGLIADQAEVLAAIETDAVQLIDTLPAGSFTGEQVMYARPGHIPNAVNICGLDMLDETGHTKPLETLAVLHLGPRDQRQITYCGGGILASLNALMMTRLGYRDVAVYTASLQEWAADPDLPMETGA